MIIFEWFHCGPRSKSIELDLKYQNSVFFSLIEYSVCNFDGMRFSPTIDELEIRNFKVLDTGIIICANRSHICLLFPSTTQFK